MSEVLRPSAGTLSGASGASGASETGPIPYGFVQGQPVFDLPRDLYIPPDAMEVVLELFEGPLDLLLYLIRKHNLDILNIPVAEITRQYVEYLQLISALKLELASDYLEMAATLTEIKSRLLLPKPPVVAGEEIDPRAALVKRLQVYERFKQASQELDQLPRMERDYCAVQATLPIVERPKPQPTVALGALLDALQAVLKKVDLQSVHSIQREVLSVPEKMAFIIARLHSDQFLDFTHFFNGAEGRLGVVVTFLSILELVREAMIELVQNESFGPIYIRAVCVGT